MTDRVSITKIDAAKRQINTAIRMYFLEMDVISTHAIAAAGLQIVSDLGIKQNKSVGYTDFLSLIVEKRRGEFLDLMRHPQNFIKHADREGDAIAVLEYNPETLEIFLFLAGQAYEKLTGSTTPEIRGLITWSVMRNPDLVIEGSYKEIIKSYIEKFGIMNDDDKVMMINNIDRARNEKNLNTLTSIDYSV
jgi:hypothetical protein